MSAPDVTIEISADRDRIDVGFVDEFLSASSYWARGRSRETVERTIANSLCFGAYAAGRQIGFARVATDRAVFAYVMDVFVLPEFRGQGAGSALMRAILAHEDLQGLRLIALRTRDAHALYARFGFAPIPDPESLMVLQAPDAQAAAVTDGARVNEFGQPIGWALDGWQPPPAPTREPMTGRFCDVVYADERFASDLYAAHLHDADARSWTYLAYGPFASFDDYLAWMRKTCFGPDPFFYVIVDRASGRGTGVAAHMRIQRDAGSIEVGHVHFTSALKRTPAATEAMFLMMERVFALGYRRYEWKCDALNWASRRAAERFGFTFEGIFRQATVYKGRNRDTAWFSITDREWTAIRAVFETWLAPSNFDEDGRQRTSLRALMRLRRR